MKYDKKWRIIYEIASQIDFARIQVAMDAVGWTVRPDDEVPTEFSLRESAEAALSCLIDENIDLYACGGWVARRERIEDGYDGYRLSFEFDGGEAIRDMEKYEEDSHSKYSHSKYSHSKSEKPFLSVMNLWHNPKKRDFIIADSDDEIIDFKD